MSDIENASEQLFAANSDLFDAEIDSDNEAIENKDGGEEEDGFVIENGGDRADKSDEEDPFHDSECEGEESLEKIKQKAKKIRTTLEITASSTKEPKRRKAKQDAVTKLHSESQRLVRESRVKLPYHQPETKDIRHFLKRVPVDNIKNDKLSRNDKATKHAEEAKHAEETVEISEKEVESSEAEDLTTTEPDTVVKPKLSGAFDPFFFDDSSSKKPAGLNHLMERFLSHNKSKLKQTKPDEISKVKEQTQNSDVAEVTDEVEKLKTTENTENEKNQKMLQPIFQPGDNLRSVKEKLQANMKLQRAEVRKIHESQRKLDEEEISDEEEEEEFDGEDEGKLS
ncbi:Hypothetical predicted protein [Paramuricea clavata]|uniref:Uncharacterized protein n=1 Tax=Paramuricea clavata TaxID=317549 RepID=A0A7D9E9X6_PARCT|nr:Hypothetical predicted protein [Paramuricea clavata]